MQWTADAVFGPTFQDMKQSALKKGTDHNNNNNDSMMYPDFELKEHDYVLGGTQKVGGNAQSIVKTGWLHHTTFLWDYSEENMKYLTLPKKRPEYRKDREHSSFLIKLKNAYQDQLEMNDFFQSMETVSHKNFRLEPVTLDEALSIMERVVDNNKNGSTAISGKHPIQAWFDGPGRTKIIDLK
jgi:lipoate-protein ligase A